jgi:hypothetical protein
MVAASALRIVRAEGSAADRGHHVGRELGDLVHRSLGFYRGVFEGHDLGPGRLEAALTPYRLAAERSLPEHVAWLDAVAEAAEVSAAELFAVNVLEELEPRSERCSSFVVAYEGSTLLGHNEMWLAGDAGNVAVVVERPSEGTPIASASIACCLPAVGLNGWRTAQGIDSLTARDDRAGVPRVLVSRHSLEARDRADALKRAAFAGRAGGYAHLFAFRGGEAAIVETTAERDVVLEGPGAHTNHYLDPELAELGAAASSSSLDRYERLEELLAQIRPRSSQEAMEVLRREAVERSHAEAGDEDYAVVFSLVCDVEEGRMWVAPGDPSTTPFEEVDLDGVVVQ